MLAASAATSISPEYEPGKYSRIIHDRSLFSTGSRLGVMLSNKNCTSVMMAWCSILENSISKWVGSGTIFQGGASRNINYPSYVLPYNSTSSDDEVKTLLSDANGVMVLAISTRSGTISTFRVSEDNLAWVRTGYVMHPKNICGACISGYRHYKIACGLDDTGSYSIRVSYRMLLDDPDEITVYEYR